MPKVTTIKISDKLDCKLEQVRAEINKILNPRVVKRNEIIILSLQKFMRKKVYRRAFKLDTEKKE